MREGWTYKRLEEVATIKSGYTPSSDDLSDVGVVPYFKVGDMNMVGNEKYLQYSLSFVDDTFKTFPHNSIAFPKNGAAIATNKKRILKQSSVVDLNTAVLIPIKNENVEYLYYWICKIDFREITRRGAVPTLDIKTLMQLEVPYPPLSEQQRIVSELDLLSSIIEKKKAQLKEYDQLAQSIFYDMFGDPVTNEKGWDVKRLGDVGIIVAGSTPSTNDESNWDGHVNWVTPAELGEQLYYGETARKLTDKGAKGLTMMPVGTVLLSSRAPIGKLAITTVPMCCNQGFKNIICNNTINNVFLYYYLKNTMDLVQALGRGATFKEVSKSAISSYKIILPPLSLQQSFAEKIETIEHQKALIQQSIAETETLFNSRMDYYFN